MLCPSFLMDCHQLSPLACSVNLLGTLIASREVYDLEQCSPQPSSLQILPGAPLQLHPAVHSTRQATAKKQALTCLGSYLTWQGQWHSLWLPQGSRPSCAQAEVLSACQLALSCQRHSASSCPPAALAWTTQSQILAPICL